MYDQVLQTINMQAAAPDGEGWQRERICRVRTIPWLATEDPNMKSLTVIGEREQLCMAGGWLGFSSQKNNTGTWQPET